MVSISINRIIAFFLCVALFLSVNTVYPISPVIIILLSIFFIPVLAICKKAYVEPIFQIAVLIYFYCIISSLISGLPITEYFKYEFYRYDGNLFYSYAPLLLLPIIDNHLLKVQRILKMFIFFAALILTVANSILHIPFFEAHNAFGGFMMIVLGLNIMFLDQKIMYIPMALNLYLLIQSDSRGSILGLLIAIPVILFEYYNYKRLKYFYIFTVSIAFIGVAIYGYFVWNHIGSPIAVGLDQISFYNFKDLIHIERNYTIYHRIYFIWPQAIHDFLSSPIFGIGFSRYDDLPYNFVGLKYLFMQNISNNVIHFNNHAHNSFLHILAELGIMGLLFFSLLFNKILKASNQLTSRTKLIVRLLTYSVIFSSLTEHRITTPAEIFPYMVIVVILLSSRREKIV